MSPSEITQGLFNALKRPNSSQSVRHYYTRISKVDRASLLPGLLGVFEKRSSTAHDYACAMLWCLDVPFIYSLKDYLLRLLENWDLSSEELVFYLRDAVSKEEFDEVLDYLESTCTEGSHLHEQIKTIYFWRSGENSVYKDHKESWTQTLLG